LATRQQDTFEAAFSKQIALYRESNLGVDIEIITRPIHDHYTQMVNEDRAEVEGIDILLCCTDWLPELVAKQRAISLDQFLNSDPPQDWPAGWHKAMRSLQVIEGVTYGVPWHDGPQVFHTRKDLFNSPKEQEAFLAKHGRPLEIPRNWSEFLQVAQFFTRPQDGLWGCCEGAYTDGHNNVYDFVIQLWSRGGELFDEKWNPVFDSPVGVEALQFYSDLFHKYRVISPECLNMGSVEVGDFYAQGNAAMMWNWCGFAAVAELPQYSKIVGQNHCGPLPAGDGPNGKSVSLNIYWVLSILKSCKDPKAAYDFIKFVMSPACDQITSLSGANGVRLSTWRDPHIVGRYPYYSTIEDVHGKTRTMPAISEFTEMNELISTAVHQVVHEGRVVEEALKQAADSCRKVLRKSGRLT
jgi:multiple sugar transport system substrate-binding protein